MYTFFHLITDPNGYLSNWWTSPFRENGIEFSSAEQYMMYQKAVTFGDTVIAEKILQSGDPDEMKTLGRAVSNYNDRVWNGVRQIVIYNALMLKFGQNYDLRKKLLSTGDDILAECARKDHVWGIGLGLDDDRRFDMAKWDGDNLLGFALMKVREALK